MPNAARITDFHTCPMVNPGPVPHVGGPVISGSPNVNIGYIPAARVGDSLVCVPAVDTIKKGSSNVFINNKEAARIGDPTQHGGVIVVGWPTVNIGESPQTRALTNASKGGAPFCEECERIKRKNEELKRPPPPAEPPPGAALLADVPKPARMEPAAVLAKQKNDGPGDPAALARRMARDKVAHDFFAQQDLTPSAAEARARTIDLDEPLEVVETPNGLALAGSAVGGGKLLIPKER